MILLEFITSLNSIPNNFIKSVNSKIIPDLFSFMNEKNIPTIEPPTRPKNRNLVLTLPTGPFNNVGFVINSHGSSFF